MRRLCRQSKENGKRPDGVSGAEVNIESKVVSISYDDSKVSEEQIQEAIIAQKHTAEAYDENAVIARTATFYAKQINCGGCAGKVKRNNSVEADPATKIVKIEYDANTTTSANFKDYFKKFDYTVTKYWDNEQIGYTRYTFEDPGSKAAELEAALKELKVADYTINEKTNTVAIAEAIKKSDLKLAAK